MLRELYIKNFAIIDELLLNFSKGFNVITGETGAGKSIIVESLAFIFGSRFSFKDIRNDVYVKAVFDLGKEEYLLERIYDKNYKSRYFLNKRQVPYYEIEKLKSKFINFHSQMETVALFDKDYQLSLIDKYLGIEDKVKEYGELFEERKELLSKLDVLNMTESEKQRRLDILRFQIDEIEAAKLKSEEDILLEEKINIYKSKSKIISILDFIDNNLYNENGVFDLLFKVKKKIQELNGIGDFADLTSRVDILYDNLNEVKNILKEKRALYDFDDDIDKLIERDNLLKKLKKKYNVLSVSDLLSVLESLKNEFNNLSSLSVNIEFIKAKLLDIEKNMDKIANEISNIRKNGSVLLSKEITSVLKNLELKNSKFEILIESTDEYLKNGKDVVEFLFSSSADFTLKPIKYVLSGGEMARIMVAIKYIFNEIQTQSTMVLDEIDLGVGGNTAFRIGKLIKEISKTTQVLCITHLPQIAVFADNHIRVEKIFNKKTCVEAKIINNEEERINEIARMFGCEYSSNTAFKHAMELLKRCKNS